MITKEEFPVGISTTKAVIPQKSVDYRKWPVIACDQFTSNPQYWENVRKLIGSSPSTYHLIFPEVFLSEGDSSHRTEKIKETMQIYDKSGVFNHLDDGFIYCERRTPYHSMPRKGLIVNIDLEAYDYSEGSQSLIRPTEGTILNRLPPRINVRKQALYEIPHILVLYDDPDFSVLSEKVINNAHQHPLYATELMMEAGSINGYFIKKGEETNQILKGFSNLIDPSDEHPLLFAMGDGNHSLATAKAIWEENKSQGVPMDDSSRYAMVELINIHDPALHFEPIHRVLFRINTDLIRNTFTDIASFEVKPIDTIDSAIDAMEHSNDQMFLTVSENTLTAVTIHSPLDDLAVITVQNRIDSILNQNPDTGIDYIHGTKEVLELSRKPETMGIILPGIRKGEFFHRIHHSGVYPRKTFSLGHAEEKRFYFELRKIR